MSDAEKTAEESAGTDAAAADEAKTEAQTAPETQAEAKETRAEAAPAAQEAEEKAEKTAAPAAEKAEKTAAAAEEKAEKTAAPAEAKAEKKAAPAAEAKAEPSKEEDSTRTPAVGPDEFVHPDDEEIVTEVDIKLLLEAGVHFGHQTKRWNPKMQRYIFGKRNDIHIIDLQKTLKGLKRARKVLMDTVAKGGNVLFVSTKRQAQEIVEREARRAGAFWTVERWLGGMLTNFETIQKRVKHLKHLEKMQDDGLLDALGKKEASKLRKQLARLEKYLCGIKDMKNLPDVMFVIDPRREHIAVKEARKLKIPIIGIVDTNCDPDEVDYVVPGNDDAIRSIRVLTQYLATGMADVHEANKRKKAEEAAAAAKEEGGETPPPAKAGAGESASATA